MQYSCAKPYGDGCNRIRFALRHADGEVHIVNHDGGANDGEGPLRRKLGKALALAGAPPAPPGTVAPPAGPPQQEGNTDMQLGGDGADVQHGGGNADLLNGDGNAELQPGGDNGRANNEQPAAQLDGKAEPACHEQPDAQPAGSGRSGGNAEPANHEQPDAQPAGSGRSGGHAEPADCEKPDAQPAGSGRSGGNAGPADCEKPDAQPAGSVHSGGNAEPASNEEPDAQPAGSVHSGGNAEPASNEEPDAELAGDVHRSNNAEQANNKQSHAQLGASVQSANNELPGAQPGDNVEPANNEQPEAQPHGNVEPADNELPAAEPAGNVEPAASVPDAAQLDNAALIPAELDMVQRMAQQCEEPNMRRASQVPSPLQLVDAAARTLTNASLDGGICAHVQCATGGAGDNTTACGDSKQLHHNGESPASMQQAPPQVAQRSGQQASAYAGSHDDAPDYWHQSADRAEQAQRDDSHHQPLALLAECFAAAVRCAGAQPGHVTRHKVATQSADTQMHNAQQPAVNTERGQRVGVAGACAAGAGLWSLASPPLKSV